MPRGSLPSRSMELPGVFDFLYTNPGSFYIGGSEMTKEGTFPQVGYLSSKLGAWRSFGPENVERVMMEDRAIGEMVIGSVVGGPHFYFKDKRCLGVYPDNESSLLVLRDVSRALLLDEAEGGYEGEGCKLMTAEGLVKYLDGLKNLFVYSPGRGEGNNDYHSAWSTIDFMFGDMPGIMRHIKALDTDAELNGPADMVRYDERVALTCCILAEDYEGAAVYRDSIELDMLGPVEE